MVNLILDFDSTIISKESLEVLTDCSLSGSRDRELILERMRKITEEAMAGRMPFQQALSERVKMLPLTKQSLLSALEVLRQSLSASFIENITNLKSHNLYIVSGGFKDVIVPLLTELSIAADQIYANSFIFTPEGKFLGVNQKLTMACNKGKVKTVQSLDLTGLTVIVGDGNTDYEVKESGLAKYFIYYKEFIARPEVLKKADFVAENFFELVKILNQLALVRG